MVGTANAVPFDFEERIMIHHEFPAHSIVRDKLEAPQEALSDKRRDRNQRKYGRLIVAALSSIPWIGGLIGANASLTAEIEQGLPTIPST
jgi:hypothetical protein